MSVSSTESRKDSDISNEIVYQDFKQTQKELLKKLSALSASLRIEHQPLYKDILYDINRFSEGIKFLADTVQVYIDFKGIFADSSKSKKEEINPKQAQKIQLLAQKSLQALESELSKKLTITGYLRIKKIQLDLIKIYSTLLKLNDLNPSKL